MKSNIVYRDLLTKILKLSTSEHLEIDVSGFENDFQIFKSDKDVFTLLVHLGYLAYDKGSTRVRIPNEEVGTEYDFLLKKKGHTKLNALVMQSGQLLLDTLAGNREAVASTIKRIWEMNYAP